MGIVFNTRVSEGNLTPLGYVFILMGGGNMNIVQLLRGIVFNTPSKKNGKI